MRVLVVEDEASVRHVLDRLLTRRGHHVLTAPSVYDAMALLLDFPEPPDVAILDLILPGMGGLAYSDRLLVQFPTIRFIYITGWVDQAQSVEAERRGRLLLKPFVPATLLSMIDVHAA